MPTNTTPFAVFAVVSLPGAPLKFAGTTRASDRGEEGRVGLPGGKVDPGETPVEALIRECNEEGWEIKGINPIPIHSQIVDGKPVQWFSAKRAFPIKNYKEMHRIKTVFLSKDQVLKSGYGNDNLIL